MPDHTDRGENADEANFYPVDGVRGECSCGNYLHYKAVEGDWTCDECGRVWNIFVDCEEW